MDDPQINIGCSIISSIAQTKLSKLDLPRVLIIAFAFTAIGCQMGYERPVLNVPSREPVSPTYKANPESLPPSFPLDENNNNLDRRKTPSELLLNPDGSVDS